MSTPLVSVIIPVRQAETTIAATIESLLRQCAGERVEVLLAVCGDDGSLRSLKGKLEAPFTVLTVGEGAGVPQLRLQAALAARGDYLVITEDHCTFPAGWLAGLTQAAVRNPGTVCGGPVDNGHRTIVGWAQYFTRYSAFLPAGPDRISRTLPGNNACYPRALIAESLELLKDGFWEAEFNDELARFGVPFVLLRKLAVIQRQDRGAAEYIPLRFRHGRCYGGRRFARSNAMEKIKLLLLWPLLPALLYFRMLRAVFQARWNRMEFIGASPLIMLYVCAWSVGEAVGYFTGAGRSCTETD